MTLIYQLLNRCLAVALILLPITYFLAPTSTVSYFPSYLIGILGIAIIPIEWRKLKAANSLLIAMVLLFTTLLISNHQAGNDISSTATYFGYALLILTYVMGFFLMESRYEWFLTAFLTVTVGAAFVSSIVSLGFYFYLDYQPLDEKRLYALGRLSNPVISALSYGAILSICLTTVAVSSERGLRYLAGFSALALMLALLLTGTRGAWIGIFASLACQIFLKSWRNRKQLVASITILVTIPVALIGALVYFDFADAILKRSFSFRPEIWSATFQKWQEASPIFGAGINTTPELVIPPNTFQHPHSIYMSTLYYGGLLSLSALFVLIGNVIWVLFNRRSIQSSKYALPLLMFGVTTLLFDGNRILEKVDFLWLCFWLPIALTMCSVSKPKGRQLPQ